MFRAPFDPTHPQFSEDSKAALAIESGPIPLDAPKITYSADDDAAIDATVRNMGESPETVFLFFISSQLVLRGIRYLQQQRFFNFPSFLS